MGTSFSSFNWTLSLVKRNPFFFFFTIALVIINTTNEAHFLSKLHKKGQIIKKKQAIKIATMNANHSYLTTVHFHPSKPPRKTKMSEEKSNDLRHEWTGGTEKERKAKFYRVASIAWAREMKIQTLFLFFIFLLSPNYQLN